MRKRLLLISLIVAFSFMIFRINGFVFAEQSGSSPESSSTSRLKTISDALVTLGYGSNSTGAWGDWGAMWNRIYSAATWTPTGDAAPSEVKSTKTFYSTSRVLQTGQTSLQPTPSPVTPAVGDASRLNTLYKVVKTNSYGSESAGAWGDWGAMWNRIYSSAIWTASSANASTADVISGKTFYVGNNRTQQVGTSLSNGEVCVNNSDCFTDTCTQLYQDSDGDTYGNPSVSTKRCGITYTGYVTNNTDCYDGNANAKPGSSYCSGTNRGDGSFDYNCDGSSATCGGTLYSNSGFSNTRWACGSNKNGDTACKNGGSLSLYSPAVSPTCGTTYYACSVTTCEIQSCDVCTTYSCCIPCTGTYCQTLGAATAQSCN